MILTDREIAWANALSRGENPFDVLQHKIMSMAIGASDPKQEDARRITSYYAKEAIEILERFFV